MQGFHFPYILPQKPSFLTHKFLHAIFKHIKIDKGFLEKIRSISKEGAIVYVTKYPSYFDLMIYHYCLRKARLPYPRLFFDVNLTPFLPISEVFNIMGFYLRHIFDHKEFPSPYKTGFYEAAMQRKTTAIFSLINPKRFFHYFIRKNLDPLEYLIEIQEKLAFPIYIIPVFIFYENRPERTYSGISKLLFSHRDKPGFLTKIALFLKQRRKGLIDIGEPLSLKDYIQNKKGTPQEISFFLRNELLDMIDKQKRVVLGPVLKSRAQIKELVLRDIKIEKAINAMAKGDKRKIEELRKKAEAYFEEIAADYSITWVFIFSVFLTWLWKRIFQGIDISESELSLIRRWAKKGYSIIYVPSHKSHVDYLVLNYLLFENHIYPPRIAAGRNLAFWPMGYIFRKCGAFFIRRSFKGAKLYTLVFDRYIKILLQEGYPIEFFIEGGRSRSGKLGFPKTGFLSILVDAWREKYCKDIVFIPISISYDSVIEESSYINEMKGLEKKPESLKQLLKAIPILKKRYGKIYIRFSDPILLSEYYKTIKDSSELEKRLGLDLVRAINKVTPVTPIPFISIPILTKLRNGFYLEELKDICSILLSFIEYIGLEIVSTIKKEDIGTAIKSGISVLLEKKILIEKDSFYCLNERKSLKLSYYKNNIIHHFIPYSFTAISILSASEEPIPITYIKRCYLLLHNLFKNEFIYELNPEEGISNALDYFLKEKFIAYEDDGFKITSLGRKNLLLWTELLRNYLESYWIAARVVYKNQGKRLREKELLKMMKIEGESLYKLRAIRHLDAISYTTFRNAIKYIKENVSSDAISQFSQWLYSLLQSTTYS